MKPISVGISSNKSTVMLAAIGAGLLLYFYWEAKSAAKGAKDTVVSVAKPVVNAINPASQTNVVQSVGTAVLRTVSPTAAAQELTLSSTIVDGIFWLQEKAGLRDSYGVPTQKLPGVR